jgi:hypothetical protein
MGTGFHIDSKDVTRCALTVDARDFGDSDAVVDLIRSGSYTGWVQTTSRVFTVSTFNPESGAVVAAELIVDANTSIHIRRSGHTWRTWTYTERAGDTHRAENVRREGIRPVEALHYRVYWEKVKPTAFKAHDIEEWRPVASRLATIEHLPQENN